jgi:hypothetical protein
MSDSRHSVVVRFPDGRDEFVLDDRRPRLGDPVYRDGRRYHVVDVFGIDRRAVITVALSAPRRD